MPAALLYLAVGFALLYFGGEVLVRGAAGLALRLGLTPLVVGLTVVAFGTSCPELAVSMLAARDNLGDVAVGNVVGSNIANIGLILALTALVAPITINRQIMRLDLPLLLAVTIGFILMALDAELGRIEGMILTAMLFLYVAVVLRLARKKTLEQQELKQEAAQELPVGAPLPRQLLYIVLGVALLVGGGHAFVEGATDLARRLNISEAVISLTVVALGTSLPELSASLVAAARKHGDIAVGNVIGSCLFNLMSIMGLTSLAFPMKFPDISLIDLSVMLAMTSLMLPMFATKSRLSRFEGGLLLLIYTGYICWLAMNPGGR